MSFDLDYAPLWILNRLESYLAPGSCIHWLKYRGDLSVIGMNGSIHIGQESNQEVREEVSEGSTRNHVN